MLDDERRTERAVSRRRLLRATAIGAGAAGAAALLGGRLPLAEAAAADETTGEVTLTAILITFVGAPIGLQGFLNWQVTKQRTDTLSLSLTANQSVSLSFDRSVTEAGFTVGGGVRFKQTFSQVVANAATIRSTETTSLTSQAQGGPTNFARPGDTTFYLLRRPRLQVVGNPTRGFRFRFLDAADIVVANLNQLLNDPATRGHIGGAVTADNIAAQYPFREGNTSGVGLLKKRYKLKKTISVGPSSSPFSFFSELASSASVTSGQTVTFDAEITSSSGFEGTGGGVTVAGRGLRADHPRPRGWRGRHRPRCWPAVPARSPRRPAPPSPAPPASTSSPRTRPHRPGGCRPRRPGARR